MVNISGPGMLMATGPLTARRLAADSTGPRSRDSTPVQPAFTIAHGAQVHAVGSGSGSAAATPLHRSLAATGLGDRAASAESKRNLR